MNYNVRISDNFLRGDHVDGEVLQHTDLNELESVAKTAINANYEDIQKLQDGTISIGNSEKLDGATLSKFATETLQNSDTKVPTSSQVKQYIDGAISGIDLDGYYTKRETDEILEDYPTFTDYAGPTTAGVVKTNVTNIGTDISAGGYLSGANRTYDQYQNDLYNTAFISKGTLENVITGKGLVSNTNYATPSKAGVIKSGYNGLQVDSTNGKTYCDTYSYANYGNVENQRFISKGTLENVITGKGLIDNTVNNLLNYYTKSEADTLLAGKADTGDIPKPLSSSTINVNTLDAGIYYMTNSSADVTIGASTDTINQDLIYVSEWQYENNQYRDVKFISNGIYYSIKRTGSVGAYTYEVYNYDYLAYSSYLTDYVKNTDYATDSKGGVIKTGSGLQVWANSGVPYASEISYANYVNQGANTFIGKGTLENVITGKGLTTKSYVDGLVGDIGTILDSINGESVGD